MNYRAISRILYPATVVLSAFLMFQAEPIFSKYLLPAFGGSASVWTTAVFLFQTVLLVGYVYSYFMARLPIKRQICIHASMLVLVALLTGWLQTRWTSSITPPLIEVFRVGSPQRSIAYALGVSLAVPFFILSTTSTLLQHWSQRAAVLKRTYVLYALSNAGSLASIALYPVIVEPFMTLQNQGRAWTALYLVYIMTFIASAIFTIPLLRGLTSDQRRQQSKTVRISLRRYMVWLFLPSLSSVLLLSATNQMNESIATVPFLWLLPLGLYLLSFVVSFSGSYSYARNVYAYICMVFVFVALLMFMHIYAADFRSEILVISVLLFSSFMIIHGALYERRPEGAGLPAYYAMIALGGVIGSCIVTFVAPPLFTQYWEYYVSLYIVAYIAYWSIMMSDESLISYLLSFIFQTRRRALIWGLVLMTVAFASYTYLLYTLQGRATLTAVRTFYGRIRVASFEGTTYLYHGNIIHGTQLTDPAKRRIPTTYYTENSGIGLAIRYNTLRLSTPQVGMRVGVIGLGTGTIAAFGRKGDTYEFYDINPAVITIAKKYFTYLSDSAARTSVLEGDGRLTLEKHMRDTSFQRYNVLALDAFSDDSIPVHLLTKEAFKLYFDAIEPEHGILAVHISNRHIDLKPLLAELAKEYSVHFMTVVAHKDAKKKLGVQSEWVLLTRDATFANNQYVRKAIEKQSKPLKKVPLWTDDYSNILWSLK